jgi:hypothetical protein
MSSFCGLKNIDINKTNKSKNIRYNIVFTFHDQKKFAKTEYVEPCDVTVAFYIYNVIGALTLYMWYITGCVLTSPTTLCSQDSTKISKKLKKSQK